MEKQQYKRKQYKKPYNKKSESFMPPEGPAEDYIKPWYKKVTAVDLTKRSGYAFEGEFSNEGFFHPEDENKVIVHCIKNTMDHKQTVWRYGVKKGGGIDWSKYYPQNKFLTFRNLVADKINGHFEGSREVRSKEVYNSKVNHLKKQIWNTGSKELKYKIQECIKQAQRENNQEVEQVLMLIVKLKLLD